MPCDEILVKRESQTEGICNRYLKYQILFLMIHLNLLLGAVIRRSRSHFMNYLGVFIRPEILDCPEVPFYSTPETHFMRKVSVASYISTSYNIMVSLR